MFFKIHESYRPVVAICDSEILGKVFEEGQFQLDVKENFYKDSDKTENSSEEEILEVITKFAGEDATFNLAGKDTTKIALKAGIISQEGIKTIQGVPFALVLV